MKLHLGSGKRFIPGYTHVDVLDYPHIDLRCSVDRMPMIGDESVEVAYACHVLEHFHRRDVQRVLLEWHRILKPGGILRIAVPDFAALVDLYLQTGKLTDVIGPIFGRGDFLYNVHYNCFDFATLSFELFKAGFKEVKHYDWRKTEHADVDDFASAYFPHMDKDHGLLLSLNVEATK